MITLPKIKKWQIFLNRIKFNSIKFKVSVIYSVVLGIILILFSAVLYFIVSDFLYKEIDTYLRSTAAEVSSTIKAYEDIMANTPGALTYAVRKTMLYHDNKPVSIFDLSKVKRLDSRWEDRADIIGVNEASIVFIFNNSEQVLRSLNVPGRLASIFKNHAHAVLKTKRTHFYNLQYKSNNARFIAVTYIDLQKQIHVLQIGVSQKHVVGLLRALVQASVVGIPLVLLFTSFIGLLFVKSILDPIEGIAVTANNITNRDLNCRVEVPHADSEIRYVVDAFNGMIARLSRSFEHINDFSAKVAHELKTPLAIIRGESELVLSKERDVKTYQQAIHVTLQEAERMRRIIEDLLLLARLDYQPGIFNLERYNLREYCQDILEQAGLLAAEKGIVVETSVDNQDMFVKIDKLHMRRVFFNLIDNAIKFTPIKGKISIKVSREFTDAVISVTDSGVGIPEKNISLIFDKFYHADFTGKNEGKSTGLGLSIAQSIVKVHGGRIWVKSQISQGSTFFVSLPLDD